MPRHEGASWWCSESKAGTERFLVSTEEEMMALKRPLPPPPTGGWKILFALRHSSWGNNLALRRGDNDCVGEQTPEWCRRNETVYMTELLANKSSFCCKDREFPIPPPPWGCLSESGGQIMRHCESFKICLAADLLCVMQRKYPLEIWIAAPKTECLCTVALLLPVFFLQRTYYIKVSLKQKSKMFPHHQRTQT